MNWIKKGEGFNQRKAESLAFLIELKWPRKFCGGGNCG